MSNSDSDARAALRSRQGPGARYDAPAAPAVALDLARRGTAYFARLLANLDDAALNEPSAVNGFNRRWFIASISLQARLLAQSIAVCRAGLETMLPPDFKLVVDEDDIVLAATLPPQALRNLFAHTEVHLNVEWRDLLDDGWAVTLRDTRGSELRIEDSPLVRAQALWRASIELNAGGRKSDVPDVFK